MTGYCLTDNIGLPLTVPTLPSDDQPYFTIGEGGIKDYYEQHGYVVLRGLILADMIDAANQAFDAEILPSKRYIYRQATANPEKHVFTSHGFMLNSILNPQSLDPRHCGQFRGAGVRILCSKSMQRALVTLFGEAGKLVQSMYFHGNPSTWPHQDSYYLDSEQIGSMVAAWIAAEDIAPGAGRFFIYPGSHKIDMQKNGGDFDIAFNHDRYKALVKDIIKEKELVCRAPALAKGDVLFWNAKTIHGSLPTFQPERSRRSFTAHYIPHSHRFLQFQSKIKSVRYETVNGMSVSRPKDQASLINCSILFVETKFPATFQAAKKTAIKLLTASKATAA